MEQVWLLSNLEQQQSGKSEASLIVLQLTSVSQVIMASTIFKIVSLVLETATQIIVRAFFLMLLQSNSAFRTPLLISVRARDFIRYCQQASLRFSDFFDLRFGCHHRGAKNARNIVLLLQKPETLLPIRQPVWSIEIKLNSQ